MRKLTIAVLIIMVIPLPAYALNNVFPEDGGNSGYRKNVGDYIRAANLAQLAYDSNAVDYVQSGLDISYDSQAMTASVSEGVVRLGMDTAFSYRGPKRRRNTPIVLRDVAYAVQIDAQDTISLYSGDTNYIYARVDFTEFDEPSIDTELTQTGYDYEVLIGAVNTDSHTVTEYNRAPDVVADNISALSPPSSGNDLVTKDYADENYTAGGGIDGEHIEPASVTADTIYADTYFDNNSSGAGDTTISILDSGSLLGEFSALDFNTDLSVIDNGETATINNTGGGGSTTSEPLPGYVEPGGFQLSHRDVAGDSVIELDTGGAITLKEPGVDYREQITVGDGDTMDLDVDLINGSTRTANQWYELAVIADSDGVEPTRLVAYDSTSTPQSSADLPTDYELFASLSQPRSGWVRTDGSSNLYEQNWSITGSVLWGQNAIDAFGSLASDASPPDNSAIEVDASGQIPPVKVNLSLQRVYMDNNGIADVSFGANELIGRLKGQTIITLDASNVSQQKTLKNVKNQSFYYGYSNNPGNIRTFIIDTIAHFEVVGE